MDHSCDQTEGVEVPTGSGDRLGEGVSRHSPALGGRRPQGAHGKGRERNQRLRPQELTPSFKDPLNPTQFLSIALAFPCVYSLIYSTLIPDIAWCLALPGTGDTIVQPWGNSGQEGLMVGWGGGPPSPQLRLHFPHFHPLYLWAFWGGGIADKD